MPDCGHMTPLPELDQQNCQRFYNIDSDGTITGFNSDIRARILHEPRCTCGEPCPSVHRYSAVAKMSTFFKTLDLLLAKMGRKMHGFAKSAAFFQHSLPNSLDTFMTDIRPNPLAATANTRLLLRRQRDVIELHQKIMGFRNQVIVPIERSLQALHIAFPHVVPAYVTLFHTRFDILEYRAMTVRIADDLKLASRLLKLADPSQGVQRQGLKMLQFVYKESLACMKYCQDALSKTNVASAASLEVELRLQQAQFLILAKAASSQISSLGCRNFNSAPPIPDQIINDSLQHILTEVGPDFPGRTAFATTAKAFQAYLSSSQTMETAMIPMISNNSLRQVEKSWGHHELGALKTCARSHLYSRKSFPDGCPDCGSLPPPPPRISGTVNTLREADFLKAMHALSAKTNVSALNRSEEESDPIDAVSVTARASPTLEESNHVQSPEAKNVGEIKQEVVEIVQPCLSDSEKKDLENREKFLSAMRKIGI